MTARELVTPIEMFAPIATQEGWDNCGFSVGDPNKQVHKALLALDCTENVIWEAVELDCDIIITHHPLIFGGIKNVCPDNFTGRIIEAAIKNNLVIYSAHTNMDRAAAGVSALMAQRLELQNTSPLTADGFGMIGELAQPMDSEEFTRYVQHQYHDIPIRYSCPTEQKVQQIAVCGGSGKSFIKDALNRGAQVYITGDIPYHDFYCEEGFMVIDIGHYDSEKDIVKLFAKILCENFPTFAVSTSIQNYNPIYYH
jgi:dinuclear metal center YbgI/SA1388 family protein